VQAPEIRRRSDLVEIDLVRVVAWLEDARPYVIFAAFIVFAWALQRQRRMFAEQLDRVLAAQQQAQQQAHADTQALAEKVSALVTLVATIPARVERPVEAPPPPTSRARREASPMRSYESARRLARSGATVEEIVATAGLAASEARLLQRLHGGREDAA
jgi:uncharacterized protein DUF2802